MNEIFFLVKESPEAGYRAGLNREEKINIDLAHCQKVKLV